MYTRQSYPPKGVSVPDNYSGHAFSQKGGYADMPPPIRRAPPHQDQKRVHEASDVPPDERILDSLPEAYATEEGEAIFADEGKIDSSKQDFIPTEAKEEKSNAGGHQPSLFSSILPKIGDLSGNFPFGHGIGSEELLILAIMLLVYLSGAEEGKNDYEFMLLLGLLLFAG